MTEEQREHAINAYHDAWESIGERPPIVDWEAVALNLDALPGPERSVALMRAPFDGMDVPAEDAEDETRIYREGLLALAIDSGELDGRDLDCGTEERGDKTFMVLIERVNG